MAWTPEGWQWAGVLLAAVVLYEAFRSAVMGAVRRRQENRVDRFLGEHSIPTDPFRHTHRVVVKEMVLSDAGLVAAMAERAQADRRPFADVQAKVRSWLDEIVPQFNLLAYYGVGYRIARIFSYAIYNVRLDRESLERAQAKIPPGAAVVFVSNHRSNADFVVTGFMVSKSVQVSYAVGEWARVWPLENLFKSFGSYFVRRGEKDPLYHRTLEAYLHLVTKQGVTQAMFPEGGLTRDGRLRPVKLGLLDMMTRAKLDSAFQKPLVFVPVGINFDRVFEDENMAAEASGERPASRTTGERLRRLAVMLGRSLYGVPVNAVRFFAKRLKKHGVCAIHFGEPVSFDEWYAHEAPFLDEPDRHARWERLRPFGEGLLSEIGHHVPVTPVPLACLALRRIGRDRMASGVDRGSLILALRESLEALRSAGAPLFIGDPYRHAEAERRERRRHRADREELEAVSLGVVESEDLDEVLDRALDVLARRSILWGGEGRSPDGLFRTAPERWPLVEYYANSLGGHSLA